jgi:hypothetical protein
MMKYPSPTEKAVRIIENFDRLPADQRVEIFRDLSPIGREELVEVIARPTELIRRISEEEMFFTIKQLGEQNAPALIAMTTGKQLLYLLDIDLWKKEMLDTYAVARWLDILSRIGEEKMLQFVQVADPELIMTAMEHLIRVKMRNPDLDFVEESDSPSYRRTYFYIDFRVPESEVLKIFLDRVSMEHQFSINMIRTRRLPGRREAARRRRAQLADKVFLNLTSCRDLSASSAAEDGGRICTAGTGLFENLVTV